jgi:hypothetical protein
MQMNAREVKATIAETSFILKETPDNPNRKTKDTRHGRE